MNQLVVTVEFDVLLQSKGYVVYHPNILHIQERQQITLQSYQLIIILPFQII